MRFTIKFSWSISYTPPAYSTTNYLIFNHFIDKFKSYLRAKKLKVSRDTDFFYAQIFDSSIEYQYINYKTSLITVYSNNKN